MDVTGRRTVPQVFIGSKFVGGCDGESPDWHWMVLGDAERQVQAPAPAGPWATPSYQCCLLTSWSGQPSTLLTRPETWLQLRVLVIVLAAVSDDLRPTLFRLHGPLATALSCGMLLLQTRWPSTRAAS